MSRHLALPFLPLLTLAAACSSESTAAPAAPADPVARGAQLVAIGGCGHCHTPMVFDPGVGMPMPDPARKLAGHPAGEPDPSGAPGAGDQAVIGSTFTSFRAPFGVVYAANLTPDVATGLGGWSEAEFVATMRTGHHKGTGRLVLPPMPVENLAALPDDDLRAIFAYLRTLPAVANRVPEPKVSPEAMAELEKAFAAAAAKGGH